MPCSNEDASSTCEIAHLQNYCPIFLVANDIIRIKTPFLVVASLFLHAHSFPS